MQPGQVAPNQNFLNRPPGPISVSHGNVQQQVRTPLVPCCLRLLPVDSSWARSCMLY